LAQAEAKLGFALPPELAELFGAMNGGELSSDVVVYGLRARPEAAGTVEQTRAGLPGLPARGAVRFGLRGGAEHLFAAMKGELEPFAPAAALPDWFARADAGAWLYGVKNADTGALQLYSTLEEMMGAIAPLPVEGFGDDTFIRAMNVVESALGEVQQGVPEGAKKRAPRKRPAKKKAARKSSAKKPARRAKKTKARRR
jgi:hypothetical protein